MSCTPSLLAIRQSTKSKLISPRLLPGASVPLAFGKPTPNFRTSTTTTLTTTMSSPKNEWLVLIPDHPSALSKRLAVRPTHIENLKPHIEAGRVVFGGSTLSKQPKPDEQPDMTGSAMLICADTEDEVRAFLANDPYTKGGAWDVGRATITPFRCAVRTAMD